MMNQGRADKIDEEFMRHALREAERAFSEGEVPVGAILVIDNQILSSAHNMKEGLNDPTAHAEILALRKGVSIKRNWRLNDATLYVTKEPCIMCAGAMINARLGRLVYGCRDARYGAVESQFQVLSNDNLNHQVEIISGALEEECGEILKRFFKELRMV
jgi:tRNA(adenine34) deaminase